MILRRLSEAVKRQDWFVVFIELLIVIFGVYIGIYLGDIQSEQQRAKETILALNALESELRSDLERLDQIIEIQTTQVANQKRVAELLLQDTFDQDVFGKIVVSITVDNDTFFPNRAAYSAMQTGGFLAALPDEDLRLRITRLFEREYVRQDLNAAQYDNLGFDFANRIIAVHWDRGNNQLIGDRATSAIILRNGALVLGEQGEFYLEFITQTIYPEIEAVLEMINNYQVEGNQ